MSEKRKRPSSRSPSPRREDWRNVRVKEEPMSDVEGSRSVSRDRHGHKGPDRDRGGRHERSERDRQETNRHRRSRSRSRERNRDRGHSNSNSRPRAHDFFDDRRDSHSNSRDRDRRDARPDRPIKTERRSGSRSPSRGEFRPPPPRQFHTRRDHEEGRRRPKQEPRDERERDRPRDPKRERDWDQFFNPQSEISQQAIARRDQNDQEREERIRDSESGSGGDGDDKKKNIEKEKPNFGLSGKLTEETNSFKGVVIKYSEPPEARKPVKTRWRLYPFKDGEALEVMYIHRQSAYLLGRERKIADIPIDHPSCSKQHAVIQYRLVPYTKPNGSKGRRIRPYVIDLESANGTLVNGQKIDPKRYVELFEKDVLKFGFSSREYVLLHEHSKDDSPLDDDGYDKSPTPD